MKVVMGCLAVAVVLLGICGGAEAYSIKDDATGGDCMRIGTWNKATKTCTLQSDLLEAIDILSNGIVLDGNNHMITGPPDPYGTIGVYLKDRTGVIVKNITANKFNDGIRVDNSHGNIFDNNIMAGNGKGFMAFSSSNNSITNSVFSGNSMGAYLLFGASGNVFAGNAFSYNGRDLAITYSSMHNFFKGNSLISANNSILLADSHGNEFRNNEITGNYTGVYMLRSAYNIFANNNITNSVEGIRGYNSAYNEIYNNNFVNNGVQIIGGGPDTYSKPAPVGGNYFCDFDGTEEGCNDLNSDGFCDVPYYFSGGADYLPWTTRDGWLTPAELIQDLTTQIQEMLNSGEITGVATATSLTQVLESALNAQDAGNERASDNILTGFIKQVEGQARAGRIAEDDARQLIDAAAEIINK